MQIFVRGLSGCTHVLEVAQHCTHDELASQVCDVTGVPAEQQRLVAQGKDLAGPGSQHNSPLGLRPEVNVQLSLRICGGVKNPGRIKNKMKRAEVYEKYKNQKRYL